MQPLKRDITFEQLKQDIESLTPNGYVPEERDTLVDSLIFLLFGDSVEQDPLEPEEYVTLIKMLATLEAQNNFCYLWDVLEAIDNACDTTLEQDVDTELYRTGFALEWAEVKMMAELEGRVEAHTDQTRPIPRRRYQLIAQESLSGFWGTA